MKAAARQIIDNAEAEIYVVDKINALEAPHAPAADRIPDTWTPEHVGKRIVEAFETLDKLPPDRGPKKPGNSWPPYLYDRGDLNSQEEMSEREKARRRRERNRISLRATGEEIRRMDVVFEWLAALYATDANLCRAVRSWAGLRSRGDGVKEACRGACISFQAFYRLRDKGVAIIVERLASAPVW